MVQCCLFHQENLKGEKVRTTKNPEHTSEIQKIEKLDMLASAQNNRGNGLCSVDCSSHEVLAATMKEEGELGQVVLGGLVFYVPSSD